MPWVEAPARMQRVAVVAPRTALRAALVRLADAGCVEIDRPDGPRPEPAEDGGGAAALRLRRLRGGARRTGAPVLAADPPDLDDLERSGRDDLLAGEAQLEAYLAAAVRRGGVAALAGWCPAARVAATAGRLAGAGAALVPLPPPSGAEPPTLVREGRPVRRSFAALVRTYGTVPYPDLDPAWPAGIAYLVMFGVMFGDAGHGALLLLGAALLYAGRPRRLARFRALWPFAAGAGIASALAGLAYGEFFGPTGVLPVLWLAPLEQPLRLLAAAVGLGAVLLALAYGGGTVNRWREGGPGTALYAASGVAGAALFAGLGLAAAGLYLRLAACALAGALLAAAGLALAAAGFWTGTAGGPAGAAQTGVQVFDALLRIASNTVSFARLAAFGLTHAALGAIVWQGTTALARHGAAALPAAALLFLAGNALAFALEALVAAVQALRLEYYELFSRVFETQGRPFRPWRLPVERAATAHPSEVAP